MPGNSGRKAGEGARNKSSVVTIQVAIVFKGKVGQGFLPDRNLFSGQSGITDPP